MQDFEIDLPDELQGRGSRAPAQPKDDSSKQTLLTQLGTTIGGLRDEAVKGRKESGIEETWAACEDAYLCIDESNRSSVEGGRWVKPTSMTGPVQQVKDGDQAKSTAFVALTPRYVDMAAAKISEIALPIDDKAFNLEATPVPELVNALDDHTPYTHPQTGQQIMQPGQPSEAPGEPAQAPQPLTKAAIAQQEIDAAADAAEKAEKRIWDWLVESNYPGEMRTVIHDSARIGVGCIKGPFPEMVTRKALSKVGGGLKINIVQKPSLADKWIDVWNLFPDPACGEDIHSGDHLFERDFISKNTLKNLKKQVDSLGVPIYMADQIDKVLEEGPGKCNMEGQNPAIKVNKERYEIWYFTGTIKKSDMEAADAVMDMPDDLDDVYAVITMVNDTVIRATVNPLETGNFPYRVLPWSRRAGHWAGKGVAEQVSLPQRMVNAGTRALLNNAGIASGPQIIIDPLGLIPADNSNVITPLKIWHRTPDAITQDVRGLFMTVDIPIHTAELMQIIEYGMKLAEEASSIPLIAQGQQGPTTPQTFGQAELQNNNANTLLRSIGMRLDDFITGPLVEDHYEMLLLDPNVPDEEKGDFKVIANGTMAMVEKAIQEQTMLQAAGLTQNPAYGINPKKWFAEYWKTKRLDPRKIQYTEDELAKMAQQQQPAAPAVQVAQIKTQSDQAIAKAKIDAEMQQVQAEAAQTQQELQNGGMTPHMASATARIEAEKIRAASVQAVQDSRANAEQAYAATEAQISRDNANARIQEMTLKRDLAMLEYAQKHNLSIEQIKADLAKVAMVENTKRAIAGVGMQHEANQNDADRAHQLAMSANNDSGETTSDELASAQDSNG